jgi:hypothetical protein
MTVDLEDLLRQGIDRLPDQVPADLARRAARQVRRHRLVIGARLVAAAATVTAAAATIGVLSNAPSTAKRPSAHIAQSERPGPIQHLRPLPSWPPGRVTHATLVSRVERAILTSTHFIAYTRRYDYNDRSKLIVSAWDYRNLHLLSWEHPHSAQLVTDHRHSHTVKFVFYNTRKWAITYWPFSDFIRTNKNQCVGQADDAPQVGDARWAAWLVSSLKCGAYTVTRHTSRNGTPVLKIVNTPKDVEYQYGVRLHMLVDATTYLPIADWQAAGQYGYYDVITWLQPTSQHLAQLKLPTPPGFTSCQRPNTRC